ncbi:regulator of G-protein signaling 9-binding protein-like [Carettochelys insculpta]|uniref:regulator of G-protein signaling 9-binding protein-like n=1 Tax=Carettochelys insculpta TaxID=44489 RepID=UPI003EC096E9
MGQMAGECAATHASLSNLIVWHRQLALQLGGTADSARLREEMQERSKEVKELGKGLQNMLLAGLRQLLASPEEQLELERLWVLSLSALELFHQDLCRAQHLCQLFPLQGQGQGPPLLRTGLTGKAEDGGYKPWKRPTRKGARSTEQLGATPSLEEQIEHVGAMLLEMETRVNVPVWTVEATEEAGPNSSEGLSSETQAPKVVGDPGCCRQDQGWPGLCCTLS